MAIATGPDTGLPGTAHLTPAQHVKKMLAEPTMIEGCVRPSEDKSGAVDYVINTVHGYDYEVVLCGGSEVARQLDELVNCGEHRLTIFAVTPLIPPYIQRNPCRFWEIRDFHVMVHSVSEIT